NKDLIKHEGKSYVAEFIRFRGSALQVTALAANEVDVAALAFSSFATALQNARLPIVAIADIFQDGPWYSTIYGVLDNSGINSLKDLKGKVVGVNAFGGAVDVAARIMLLKNGLKPGKDVSMIEARFGAQEAMLRAGKVDVGSFVAPLWAKAQRKGGIRPLFYQRDAMGTTEMIFHVAKKGFIRKNRAALVDFYEDYIRAMRWFMDTANRKEAMDYVSKFTKRPAKAYAKWAMKEKTGYYHDLSARLNLKALQRNVDQLHSLKFLKNRLDIPSVVDESVIKEAAARLK
ncbi:MAG: ABC transporter substrate-binding protein, partial [bacterium]